MFSSCTKRNYKQLYLHFVTDFLISVGLQSLHDALNTAIWTESATFVCIFSPSAKKKWKVEDSFSLTVSNWGTYTQVLCAFGLLKTMLQRHFWASMITEIRKNYPTIHLYHCSIEKPNSYRTLGFIFFCVCVFLFFFLFFFSFSYQADFAQPKFHLLQHFPCEPYLIPRDKQADSRTLQWPSPQHTISLDLRFELCLNKLHGTLQNIFGSSVQWQHQSISGKEKSKFKKTKYMFSTRQTGKSCSFTGKHWPVFDPVKCQGKQKTACAEKQSFIWLKFVNGTRKQKQHNVLSLSLNDSRQKKYHWGNNHVERNLFCIFGRTALWKDPPPPNPDLHSTGSWDPHPPFRVRFLHDNFFFK